MEGDARQLERASEAESGPRDVAARHVSAFPRRERIARLIWAIAQATLFRLSFTTWFGYRNRVLRLFRARVHPSCRIRRLARFECPWNFTAGANTSIGDHAMIYCLGPVTLGERVTVSQNAHLCAGTHDYNDVSMPLLRPPITIGDDVWIAADAFVGPNVTVGEGAILGARGCACSDLEPWSIYTGNPAKKLKDRARPVGLDDR
jgi:putative colanic acid biosynthesis acetyltransferase WcaF